VAEAVAKPSAQPSSGGIRRPVPKAAWLGGGALLIAGGISYGIFTSMHGSPSATVTPPPSTTQTSAPDSTGLVDDKSKTDDRKTGDRKERGSIPPPYNRADTGTRTQTGGGSVTTDAARQLKAETYYGQAVDLNRKRLFCDGRLPIDEAVKLDPANPKYLNLQHSTAQACIDMQTSHKQAEDYYQQAELQFQQGDSCEGKSTIDKSVHLEPSNSKYIELQKSLTKACNLP
jgi:hypothetical protein